MNKITWIHTLDKLNQKQIEIIRATWKDRGYSLNGICLECGKVGARPSNELIKRAAIHLKLGRRMKSVTKKGGMTITPNKFGMVR